MKGFIMKSGRAARRSRILKTLEPDRRERIKVLRDLIESGRYTIDGKVEMVVEELIDQAIKLRA